MVRIRKGHIALAKAVFPEDTMGSKLDVLARMALWEAGLDYRHGTGHGERRLSVCILCSLEGLGIDFCIEFRIENFQI